MYTSRRVAVVVVVGDMSKLALTSHGGSLFYVNITVIVARVLGYQRLPVLLACSTLAFAFALRIRILPECT